MGRQCKGLNWRYKDLSTRLWEEEKEEGSVTPTASVNSVYHPQTLKSGVSAGWKPLVTAQDTGLVTEVMMPWPERVPLGSPQLGEWVLLSYWLCLTQDKHVAGDDSMFDHAPSLRVNSRRVNYGFKKLSIWRCLEARRARWVGVLTGKAVCVLVLLLLSGDSGASQLARLALLSNSAATQDSGSKWTSLLELYIHCVQFCCLINPPSWSGSHPKYGKKTEDRERSTLYRICFRKKLKLQVP